ncbi:phosphomannomutase [Aliihoeflea sp. 40Bstr573]|uniref:phosphomannomutase n=1 Tax=Aliihoeflea sp. 40Bstr573 TaxID=2696467 RepID=UPI0020943D3F|nr:phosphomannomutase [Aliihoeflea sp. 40Bstr573]MCO6387512.1 phosphomannomutase [Aliihoeflea sp. 40Bstr573]
MTTKFGTSGVRGLVTSLLAGDAHAYASAFAAHLVATGQVASGGSVLIGWDLRESSPRIAEVCRVCVEDAGLSAVFCGEVPTPALALAALQRGRPAMMITGSHIPADRNGIKFYRADGEIGKVDEVAIHARAVSHPRVAAEAAATPDADWSNERSRVVAAYLERCANLLPPGALAGMTVGVYEHSSVARDILHDVLRGYGADTVALERSGHFTPVDTEAVSPETIGQLRAWAAGREFDAIVSTDGDGDRPLLADSRGEIVRGDVLGILSARMLGAATLVTPVTSNSGVERAGDWEVMRTRVGSPFVIAGMENAKLPVLGFEANGGVLVGRGFMVEDRPLAALETRDCIVPILATLAAAKRAGTTVADVVAALDLPVNASDRLQDIAPETSAELVDILQSGGEHCARFLAGFAPLASIDKTDGLRMSLADGCIVHLRPSGNAPELRCYIESPSAAQSDEMLRLCLQRVEQFKN